MPDFNPTLTEHKAQVRDLQGAHIDSWRTAKSHIDSGADVAGILGCVGEPLVAFIEDSKEAREACLLARDGLLGMVNDHRQRAAESAWEDLHGVLETLDYTDIREELDSSDSPDDAADKAFYHAAAVLESCNAYAPEIDSVEDL
jgi:hypothetical protein